MDASISDAPQGGPSWAFPDDPARVLRSLERLLDEDGAPRHVPMSEWWPMLAELDRMRRDSVEPWPDSLVDRVRAFLLVALRFSRPDGSGVLTTEAVSTDQARLIRRCAEGFDETGVGKVSRWWFGRRGARTSDAPPPLPSWGSDHRPIAMLRADWAKDGDFLAIDHRAPGSVSAVEIQAGGHALIGPRWTTAGSQDEARRSTVKRLGYSTRPTADWFEWSFRQNGVRIVRSAVFLRGRRLALLADECHGAEASHGFRLDLADGVSGDPVKDSRAIALRGKGVSARAIPLGLPSRPYTTDRGQFRAEGTELVLNQKVEGRRSWLPLLVSWDRARNRRVATWRVLTVTHRSKVCPPDVAFAARVTWGPGDGLVVYRSLARPTMRVFLGHQTEARFLIGLFDADGNVRPLLKLD